ncbi:hypothetical protein A4A49_54432 [Nicotiana attenuata]|uniref:Putative plant transposon protein domain-containing protein n=1 Tax=Nicotiana attenuata TaxID=49451 RepID=A0A1J6IN22_NICAT|nr:hypothetical protein A4A49_54432 [Nicotiana attenuata]
MKDVHCLVVSIFDFQRLSPLFDTIGNTVYEEPVRMFYAKQFVNDKDDLDSMVQGTHIVFDAYQYENKISAKFHGYDVFVQNSWPEDFEVSIEEAKDTLSENSPNIGPKSLKFEHRVLAHMIATTLLPRTGSFITLTTRDIFVLYFVKNKRLDWFVWICSHMLESIKDISSFAAYLPYGLLISHILEVMKVDLVHFSPKLILGTYDNTAFAMLDYTLSEDGCARHVKIGSTLVQTHSSAANNLQQIQQGLDGVKTMLISMKEQVDKIRDVTKEKGIDVSKLMMDMGATKRQGIRAFNSMTEKMDKLTKEDETSYDSCCTEVINTLKYFLGRN